MILAHPYHVVLPSPWPMASSIATINFMLTTALSMHGYVPASSNLLLITFLVLVVSIVLWLKDTVIEGSYLGDHTLLVRRGFGYGFNLFVLSEVLIFAAIFWAYLHSAINPLIELGLQWAPLDIVKVEAMELPLLNTILLLSSGATVLLSHHKWINGDYKNSLIAMFITTLLVVVFVVFQVVEYILAQFTITDGVFGSLFYAGTGLHGFHMITLILMLSTVTVRMYFRTFSRTHSTNLDTTIIYSHVLDVIWLALFVVFYVWV